MKFTNKKALLFDFDGTLIDSAPDLALTGNLMLRELGREPFSEAQYRQWIGNGARVMVQRALSGTTEVKEDLCQDMLDQATALFFDIYRSNCCVKTQLYPEVKETLEALKSQGYPLVILSNKPIEFIAPVNRALDLDGLFDLCIGGDSLPWKKPDPKPLQHVCEHYGITIAEALMIGDSKNDILAANAADMHSIGVSYGYNYGEDIGIYNPTIVVDNFSEILQLV